MTVLTTKGVAGETPTDPLEAALDAVEALAADRSRDLEAEAEALRQKITTRDAALLDRRAELTADLEFEVAQYTQARAELEEAGEAYVAVRDRTRAARRRYEEVWNMALAAGCEVPVRLEPLREPQAFRDAGGRT